MTYLRSEGSRAAPVTTLTWALLAASVATIVIICALLVAALARRREFGAAEALERREIVVTGEGDGLSWIYWGTGVSTLALLGATVWSMSTLARVGAPPGTPALTIEIVGHQWWWEIRYPNAANPNLSFTTANEIHIPAGVPVRVRLQSADVIHSFWVPLLSGKTDLIPGQTNLSWIEAEKPGAFRGQCGEYCGLQHANMALLVVAEPLGRFEAWRASKEETRFAATISHQGG